MYYLGLSASAGKRKREKRQEKREETRGREREVRPNQC